MKKYAGYELNFSEEELTKRLEYQTKTIHLLDEKAQEYQQLSDGDKKTLKNLILAAKIINDVYLQQDHALNLELKKALEASVSEQDTHAGRALELFNSLNGVLGLDRTSTVVKIFKDVEENDGKNFYPQDLSAEEFQSILIKLIKNGQKDEVENILNTRTMVVRDDITGLKGIDYTEYFATELNAAADKIEEASKTSSHKVFAEYLVKQAAALRTNDIELDCEADRVWAGLQGAPIEFTISREQYEDNFSGVIYDNEELKKLLAENNVDCQTKDSIGVRVGLVNEQGTEDLQDYKKYLPELAGLMPFADKYESRISSDNDDAKQAMADADIVYLSGDYAACRGGVTLAQNLQNDDKLSVKRGHGRRNIYHRQVRMCFDPAKVQKRLDAVLDKSLHSNYKVESDHDFTIGHENVHSLGPADCKDKLGVFSNIIEEAKADMGSLAFLDYFVEKGKYTKEYRDIILTTWSVDNQLKAKPKLEQAHRVRSVMQTNYFVENNAVKISDDGIISVDLEKMVPTAKKMLEEVIKIQLSRNPDEAKAFIDKYFVWNEKLEKVAENISKIDDTLHIKLNTPLADYLLISDI